MNQTENDHLIAESRKIAESFGKMFAPFCEVVLHDLRDPEHAIVAIENNLSGRSLGGPTTNMGYERVKTREFPDVVQNYPNVLPDGRRVKSTSIGIRNQQGDCIGSICLNFDISNFSNFNSQLSQLISTTSVQLPMQEQLRAAGTEEIYAAIAEYAKHKNISPAQLSSKDKRLLVQSLNEKGFLRLRNSISTVATALQVTRPTVYNYLKAEVQL